MRREAQLLEAAVGDVLHVLVHVVGVEAEDAVREELPVVRDLELDALAPSIAAVSNKLLGEAYGSRYLVEFFNLAKSVKKAAAKGEVTSGLSSFEQLVELGKSNKLDANDQHIINIVDWLWQFAFDQRASDIHFEPKRNATLVRLRIDGMTVGGTA